MSYQHGGRHFSKDHVYVRSSAACNFTKAHLSPSHIHSRKLLHFFFSMGVQIGPALHNPLSHFLFPLILMVQVHTAQWWRLQFTYLVSQCCWLQAHDYQHIHHAAISFTSNCSGSDFQEGSGNCSLLPTCRAAPLSTSWYTKASYTAHRPCLYTVQSSEVGGGRVANRSQTSLLRENQHIQHDSNQTTAHQTGFQTVNLLSVSLQLWGLHYWLQCCWAWE